MGHCSTPNDSRTGSEAVRVSSRNKVGDTGYKSVVRGYNSTVTTDCNTGKMQGVSRTDPQINIRIPAELKRRLEDAADTAGRTLTGEVVRRLDDSFGGSDPVAELRTRVDELERQVAALKRKR